MLWRFEKRPQKIPTFFFRPVALSKFLGRQNQRDNSQSHTWNIFWRSLNPRCKSKCVNDFIKNETVPNFSFSFRFLSFERRIYRQNKFWVVCLCYTCNIVHNLQFVQVFPYHFNLLILHPLKIDGASFWNATLAFLFWNNKKSGKSTKRTWNETIVEGKKEQNHYNHLMNKFMQVTYRIVEFHRKSRKKRNIFSQNFLKSKLHRLIGTDDFLTMQWFASTFQKKLRQLYRNYFWLDSNPSPRLRVMLLELRNLPVQQLDCVFGVQGEFDKKKKNLFFLAIMWKQQQR